MSRRLKFKGISSGIKVKLEGDWVGANKALSSLGPQMTASYLETQTIIAKKLKKRIVNSIKNQKPYGGGSWKPLAPSTKERKGSSRIYEDTLKMVNSINILRRGTSITVGIHKSHEYLRGSSNGLEAIKVADVAAMNEFGGGKLPARPLWRPAQKSITKTYVINQFRLNLSKSFRTITSKTFNIK